MEEYTRDRLGGLACKVVGDSLVYGSLIWGVASVIRDPPSFVQAGLAGGCFVLGGALNYISLLAISSSETNFLDEQMSCIEQKVSDLEKTVRDYEGE